MKYFFKTKYILYFLSIFLICTGIIYFQLQKYTPISYVQDQPSSISFEIGGPFKLIDQNNKQRQSEEFLGKYCLIYFGYSYCPDICPLGLQNMSKAINFLKRDRDQIIPIFITIDPVRDTVEHLKVYGTNFHPNFVMLTGTQQEINSAMGLFHVYAARSQTENGLNDYLMDHSTLIYLMDKNGKFLKTFPHTIDPEKLAFEIEKHFFPMKKNTL